MRDSLVDRTVFVSPADIFDLVRIAFFIRERYRQKEYFTDDTPRGRGTDRTTILNKLIGQKPLMLIDPTHPKQHLVGTFTIIFPGLDGTLPADEVFGPELDRLREGGKNSIVEAGGLATRTFDLPVIRKIVRRALEEFTYTGADILCITVNPDHLKFYTKVIGFTLLTEDVRSYTKLKGAPAAALIIRKEHVPSAIERIARKLH